nr:hypothetical protein CFP56_74777 [Quercus suber]
MKILIKHTYNNSERFGLTNGANPGKTHGIREVPPSPTDSDNTTATGAKTEPQDGNKINETALEEKTNERDVIIFQSQCRNKEMEEDRPEVDHVELALNLYRNTMTDDWGKVVEMYKQHTLSAIEARINTSEDTALHVAVSIAPEHIVKELIQLITFNANELNALLTFNANATSSN